jgi:hypothetical protein
MSEARMIVPNRNDATSYHPFVSGAGLGIPRIIRMAALIKYCPPVLIAVSILVIAALLLSPFWSGVKLADWYETHFAAFNVSVSDPRAP